LTSFIVHFSMCNSHSPARWRNQGLRWSAMANGKYQMTNGEWS